MSAKNKPESDCGPSCEKLNEREHKMHLLSLDGHSAALCYRETAKKGQKPSAATCETNGPKILRSAQIQAAFTWHRYCDSVRYAGTKQRAVEILAATLEGLDPKTFVDVTADSVRMKDWSEIPGELTRAVQSVSETVTDKGGVTIKQTFRDPVAVVARLAKLLGWDEPEQHEHLIPDAEAAKARLAEIADRRARAAKKDDSD